MTRMPGLRLALAAGVCLTLSGAGCRTGPSIPGSPGESAPDTGPPSASADTAAVLTGCMKDERGRPVPDVRIVLFAGFATRWRVAETRTDAQGRYEFNPMSYGSLIRDEPSGRWDYFVGIQIEHATRVSADGRSWWDLTVSSAPGAVTRFDLTLIPGGAVEGVVRDAGAGAPRSVDLRLYLQPPGDFLRYTATDARGAFRQSALFPGRYVADLNDPSLEYPVIGEFDIRAGQTTRVDWTVALPPADADSAAEE